RGSSTSAQLALYSVHPYESTNQLMWSNRLSSPGNAVGFLSPQPPVAMATPQPSFVNGPSSRYRQDFYELNRLGKGAYGSVFRVMNKLDGTVYAVKKIRLDESQPDEVF
ncbi:hypothetical protein SARC_11046, partial [Sphaeroforma arctica JP610]